MLKQWSLFNLPLPCLPIASLLRRQHHRCFALSANVSSAGAVHDIGHEVKVKVEVCKECKGTGKLAAGGYHKRNPVNAAKLIDSKWTAREAVLGWRHFTVTERRKSRSAEYALLVATCDSQAQIWINIHNLKDRSNWACGWLQKTQLAVLDEQPGAICKACQGSGLGEGYVKL